MAVSNLVSMLIDLYKNNNTTSKTYGKYYGHIFKRNGLNLKGFARHIAEHGSLVKYDLAVLVLQNIVSCLKEMMVQGIPVKLDGLGTFSPGITGTGADSIAQYELQFEYAWNIKAGVPYLVKPERTVEMPMLEYKGNLQLAAAPIPADSAPTSMWASTRPTHGR